MPLYELVCLARPKLARPALVKTMRRIGELVMDKGGVLTSVRSYGEQHLAYDIRRPFERYSQAHVWQMNFMVNPEVLKDITHELRVDENVLRWMTVRRAWAVEASKKQQKEQAQEQ